MEIIATDPNDQRKIDYTREHHGLIIGYAACTILTLIGIIHLIVGNGTLLYWLSFVSFFIVVRLTTYSWQDSFLVNPIVSNPDIVR